MSRLWAPRRCTDHEGPPIRVDSDLFHSEVVRPAVGFLHQQGFEASRAEFLKAHDYYPVGETKAAIAQANTAFESTLKAISHQRGWT